MNELPKLPGLKPHEVHEIEMNAYRALEEEANDRGDASEFWRLRDEADQAMVQMQDEKAYLDWGDKFRELYPGVEPPKNYVLLYRAVAAKGGFEDIKPESK